MTSSVKKLITYWHLPPKNSIAAIQLGKVALHFLGLDTKCGCRL